MSFGSKYRDSHNTSSALFPYVSFASAELRSDPRAKLTGRTITITDRREIEVKERKGTPPLSLFGSSYTPPGAETTRKWESEQVIEIEETYE